MASSLLVGLDVEQGARVLQALEERGLKINVALWVLSDRYSDWRMVLASRSLDQNSLWRSYGTVNEALRDAGIGYGEMPTLWLIDMKDPFIKALRKNFSKAQNAYGIRLSEQLIGDLYVIDAFVYKIV